MAGLAFVGAVVVGLRAKPDRASPAGEIVGQATVTDARRIEIGAVKIRLSGIDAPGMGRRCRIDGQAERCGQKAALALENLLGSRTVYCDSIGRDRYGRVLARCHIEDADVNGWLVEQGWAVAYRRHSTEYVAQEDRARNARRGIWAGTFEDPEVFRAAERRAFGP